MGCSEKTFDSSTGKTEIKIAILLPGESQDRWERIMDLAQKNISEATDIKPVFDFYDEDSVDDILSLAYELANDESVVSVIGCEDESNTDMLAYQMSRLKKKKPMFTFNTSQNVIRKYSTKGFMWGLSESDITQSEVLLAYIASLNHEHKNIALIANKGSYGQTFIDWFAFQAEELELNPIKLYSYEDPAEIKDYMADLYEIDPLCHLIFVPNSEEETLEMVKLSNNYLLFNTYFSHKAFSNESIKTIKENIQDTHVYMMGTSMVANPSSGFQSIYEMRYNESPINGEAQLYDAIMISSLAYAVSKEFDISVNDAVSSILRKSDKDYGAWTKQGIEKAYETIVKSHEIPAISGALGILSFIPDSHSIIQYSTYAINYLKNFELKPIDFISRDSGTNTSSITGAWHWNKLFNQTFNEDQEDRQYPARRGNKAIIIAGSSGWDNYRHQADALAFYQLLKRREFSDEDIILIMADDLANNPKNPYPGEVVRVVGEENLYKNLQIDYKLDELSPDDLRAIFMSERSEKLPAVLDSDDGDNILLFWSGHGLPGILNWGDDERSINDDFFSGLMREMQENDKFRKMFVIIEACYSGGVARACEGIPGLLLMTAANHMETSKAEGYDSDRNTYLTNTFTSSVLNCITNSSPSISQLYQDAFKLTMGSHVTIYNLNNYGNAYTNYCSEFFFPYSE